MTKIPDQNKIDEKKDKSLMIDFTVSQLRFLYDKLPTHPIIRAQILDLIEVLIKI